MQERDSLPWLQLDRFTNPHFSRGAPRWLEAIWLLLAGPFVSSWLPGSGWRRAVLRAFGARVEGGVIIKPGVRIKFPWRLELGRHCWIGESVWIDNLGQVTIGEHCCISQGAYLCTGSHDWSRATFDLIVKPIIVEPGSWVCAMARIGPGVTVGRNSIVGFGAILTANLGAAMLYRRSGQDHATIPRPAMKLNETRA
jgi:putative colanic acid biosynthesis acetyltransferase WcaF